MEKWNEILTAQRNPNHTLSVVSFCYIRFSNGGGFVPPKRDVAGDIRTLSAVAASVF